MMAALTEYRRKRDFRVTAEPKSRAPRRRRRSDPIFVVQLHHARARHYDFRLELGGVLKSWAVPKGPSFDPRVKRLAVEVEDHPLGYADFEGEIPAGQYGAGNVRIFDRGDWQPLGQLDAAAQLRKGHLEFELRGGKLRGAWHLVRTRPAGRRQQWLLFKARDRFSGTAEADELVDAPAAHPPPRHATPARAATAQRVARPARRAGAIEARAAELAGAVVRKLPAGAFAAQLATLVAHAPDGEDWLHEVKWDGYRLLATIRGGEPTLWSRNAIEWTTRVPSIVAALRALGCDGRFDGELVALEDGRSDFNALQRGLSGARDVKLVYVLFDLLQAGAWSIEACALEDRKSLLRELLASRPLAQLQYSDHRIAGGDAMFAEAQQRGLEGIVSKRRNASYRAGRSDDWRKVKTVLSDEFAIVGYTEPKGSRTGLGSLLLAAPDGSGGWRYVGRVGSGFSQTQLGDLARRLARERRDDPPVRRESIGATLRNAHWVEPRIAAEIYYRGIGNLGLLRQPSLKTIRTDKDADDLLRESASRKRRGRAPEAAMKEGARAPAAPRKRMPRSAPANARAPAVSAWPQRIRLTHPERVVYPDGFTKGDVASYYVAVMPQLLAAIRNRPLSIIRCPEGLGGQCFFQKHVTRGLKRVGVVPIREESGTIGEYVFAADAEAVLELVQFNALEFHPWAATSADPEHTDYIVFDLDPAPDVAWKDVVAAAECVRRRCRAEGLAAFVRTTGGKGLHVVVPLRPAVAWSRSKEFAHAFADALVAAESDRFIAQAAKNRRGGRIFIDYLRNARGATSVASYSLRARPGAHVATPLRWEELRRIGGPGDFDIRSVPARLRRLRSDPWRDFYTLRQSLPAATKEAKRRRG